MKPSLTIDWANLTRTEKTTNGHPTQIASGQPTIVVGLSKKLLTAAEATEQNRTFRLVHRIVP